MFSQINYWAGNSDIIFRSRFLPLKRWRESVFEGLGERVGSGGGKSYSGVRKALD